MRCRSLIAYLNKEFGPIRNALMRIHIAACPKCRKIVDEEADLSREIRRLEDTPVPQTLREKLLSDAIAAAASANTQTTSSQSKPSLQGVLTMKKGLIAIGLVAVIVAVCFGILPHQKGCTALADVAQAMANVKSVYFTGFEIRTDGERKDWKIWIKQGKKCRAQVKSARGLYEMADDGDKRIELIKSTGACSATISKSGEQTDCLPSLNWFSKDGMLEMSKMGIVDLHSATLPDGRSVLVIELAGIDPGYSKTLVTIDENTDLLVELEEYRDGKLVTKIEHIDYNADMPDSMFELKIPKGALVNDKLHAKPESSERQAKCDEISKQMNAEGGRLICSLGAGDSCGCPNHSGMQFTILSKFTYIWYVESRNAYYVFGKAIATDSKRRGFKRVVEDGWLAAPYKPDRLPGTFGLRIDKPGDYREFKMPYDRSYDNFCVERVQNIGKGPLVIMDDDGCMTFYGEAKFYPQGKIYHNGQRYVLEDDIRPILKTYDLAKADFGNLPASEVKAMKAEMNKHNRAVEQYFSNEKKASKRLGLEANFISNIPPGSMGQDNYFYADPEVGMILYYVPSRDSIYVAGRAKLVERHYFRRVERIVENEEVKAPGPEYKCFYQERQKRSRQIEVYNKSHTKLTFDEWLKQHPEMN